MRQPTVAQPSTPHELVIDFGTAAPVGNNPRSDVTGGAAGARTTTVDPPELVESNAAPPGLKARRTPNCFGENVNATSELTSSKLTGWAAGKVVAHNVATVGPLYEGCGLLHQKLGILVEVVEWEWSEIPADQSNADVFGSTTSKDCV